MFFNVFYTFYKNHYAKRGDDKMTEYQRNKIPELRKNGMGYKAIANVLGLSRDIVRGFCKKYGLEGDAILVQKNIEVHVKNGILCPYCSKPLTQPKLGRKKRFCCDECRRAWWKENQSELSRKDTAFYSAVCTCCGKEFRSYGNKSRKYCSHECYIKDRFGGNQNGI